jgi:hypothetical protein
LSTIIAHWIYVLIVTSILIACETKFYLTKELEPKFDDGMEREKLLEVL